MSKKYIIEIAKLYKAVGFKSLVFDQEGLDKLTPYIETEDQESYQRGLDAAWDAVRKLVFGKQYGGYLFSEMQECFGSTDYISILKTITAAEAVEKIREYEQRKAQEDAEIKVGDEVKADKVVCRSFSEGGRMPELRPCPFCGSRAKMDVRPKDMFPYKVRCPNPMCNVLPSTWVCETEEEATEAWNRRADA